MIARSTAPSLVIELLLHFIGVEVLKEVSLLPLVIAHVKGVTRHVVVLLTVKIFSCWQRVVVWARLHCGLIASHSVAEATLMLYLSRRVVRAGPLDHPISVSFHYFLTGPRLPRHHLSAAIRVRIIVSCLNVLGIFTGG